MRSGTRALRVTELHCSTVGLAKGEYLGRTHTRKNLSESKAIGQRGKGSYSRRLLRGADVKHSNRSLCCIYSSMIALLKTDLNIIMKGPYIIIGLYLRRNKDKDIRAVVRRISRFHINPTTSILVGSVDLEFLRR